MLMRIDGDQHFVCARLLLMYMTTMHSYNCMNAAFMYRLHSDTIHMAYV